MNRVDGVFLWQQVHAVSVHYRSALKEKHRTDLSTPISENGHDWLAAFAPHKRKLAGGCPAYSKEHQCCRSTIIRDIGNMTGPKNPHRVRLEIRP
jgi:hypothetical protein